MPLLVVAIVFAVVSVVSAVFGVARGTSRTKWTNQRSAGASDRPITLISSEPGAYCRDI